MSWNIRMFKEDREVLSYSFREVHYNEDGSPIFYSSEPLVLLEDTVDDLDAYVGMVSKALGKSVLTKEDFV